MAIIAKKGCSARLRLVRPAGGSIGFGILQFTRAPDRHADRDGGRDEPARYGDIGAAQEDVGRIGVEREPPPEESGRRIDRPVAKVEPDRKSVVEGKSVSVRVDLGGRRIIQKTKKNTTRPYKEIPT